MKNVHYPRVIAWSYAATHNYYWLPCRLCGRYYGGQEGADISIYSGGGSGWSVCWRCGEEKAKEIQEISDAHWKAEGIIAIDGRKIGAEE